jgi:lauroyl/myristoyl acyltransferase
VSRAPSRRRPAAAGRVSRESPRERGVYLAYAAGWRIVRALPERSAYALFRSIADGAWRLRGASVRRLEGNLRRVVGEDTPERDLRALSRLGMRSYLRYWCDTFRFAGWSPERVVDSVDVVGFEHYSGALAAGRGMVLALPHMGNWDHAGAWSALQGGPVTTVAERLRPERLYERFVAHRESLGMEIVALSEGTGEVFDRLGRAARANRVVCLLADRDLKDSGVQVSFFGAPAAMPAGPAVVAIRTGAPLIPTTVSYTARGIRLRFHRPVAVPASGPTRQRVTAMTQAVADAFAQGVAEHPQDWHMLQPLWTADVAGRDRGDARQVSTQGRPA